MNILIGISWPFVNGELHLGHAASSLSGDVIARYHRLKGNNVVMVSGSDCHGTPIDIQSIKENIPANEIVDKYHKEMVRAFNRLGFSYDLYNRTDDPYHKKIVQENFLKYYEKGLVYAKEEEQLYCEDCGLFLADRYIIGICPKCGAEIKGDECEKCGSLLQIDEVKEKKCAICGHTTSLRKTKNLYFAFSKFQSQLEKMVEERKYNWRENAYLFSKRYLEEGIPDRCCTRSLKWGIDVPIPGFEDKKIYVWTENVVGYISACKKYCESVGLNWEDYWKNNGNIKSYFVHAKDNIPFHTIILPSLLMGLDDNYHLPDRIISDEYLTIEGEKLSKSKGNYIAINDILDRYPADSLRYYLLSNDPDKRDFNFTWLDYINTHNGELLGKYGNFINRNLVFINKSFNGKLDVAKVEPLIEKDIVELYDKVGNSIDEGNIKEGINLIFEFINKANKYFDEQEPWNLFKNDLKACNDVLYNCVNIIYNLNNLLKPYLPFTSEKVDKFLNEKTDKWEYQQIKQVNISSDIYPLYERYDKDRVTEEINHLNEKKANKK